jgi:hypothetical protein
MGLGGQTVDAIDFLTAKIKKMEARIEQIREGMTGRQASSFVERAKLRPMTDRQLN